MMKTQRSTNRWWVVWASILMLSLGGIVWFNSGEPPIEITGDLSAQDVAEIKGVVRRELRSRILPGFSLQNIKQLPGNVKNYARLRIRSIQVFTNRLSSGPFTIDVFDKSGVNSGAFVTLSEDAISKSIFKSQHFVVAKGVKGWEIKNASLVYIRD